MKAENKRQNPFFLPYGTPHDTAPFDRITLEDYEEAMMEGIRRDDEQIEKIINNPEKPTFRVSAACSSTCCLQRLPTRWTLWHRR